MSTTLLFADGLKYPDGVTKQFNGFAGEEFGVNFRYRNLSKSPLIIYSVSSSYWNCSAIFTKEPIAPQAEGTITVKCGALEEGFINKNFLVSTTIGPTTKLSVSGTLKKSSSNPQKNIVVFVDSNLSQLKDLPCFQSWQKQLLKEGRKVTVVDTPTAKAGEVFYKEKIIDVGQFVEGSILIGHLPIPVKNLDVYKIFPSKTALRGVRSSEDVATILPLMDPLDHMSPAGVDKNYYAHLNKWVGYISTGNTSDTINDVNEYCKYFEKNLKYRTCKKNDNLKVVGYVASDWNNFYSGQNAYKCLSDSCYTLTDLSQLETLNAKAGPVDFCQISSHSDPTAHFPDHGFITTDDIRNWDPNVKFYNLFACSAGKGIGRPNLAMTYLFNSETLGVIASTKTGSVEAPNEIYSALKNGKSFGDSMISYFQNQLGSLSSNRLDLSWNAGLVFYGDPSLGLHHCE